MISSNEKIDLDLHQTLSKYWGYDTFLQGQLEICKNILNGKDSFAVMATGSGKSLTFQLPAVYLREKGKRATVLVISPLISLIDDQVAQLLSVGIDACALGSNSLPVIEARAQLGDFTVVYSTPEKILSWQCGLKEMMKNTNLICIAVDESHCVSEWGNDFRPDYRRLGMLREMCHIDAPIVALTASATPAIQEDIITTLRLIQPLITKSSLNRSNLKYCVLERTSSNDLIRLLREYRQEQLLSHRHGLPASATAGSKDLPSFYSTLVYVNSKKEAEELARSLVASFMTSAQCEDIRVAFYHAGMEPQARSAVHMAFSQDEVHVVIATVAFGMGINKPDVRLVIHHGMPRSVEAYYQQTGRAGRDGKPARCILLYSRQDEVKCFHVASRDFDSINISTIKSQNEITPTYETFLSMTAIERLHHQLQGIKRYCTTGGRWKCRRCYLLEYFGEKTSIKTIDQCHQDFDFERNINCCDLCDQMIERKNNRLQTSNDSSSADGVKKTSKSIQFTADDVSKEVYLLLCTIIDCGEAFGMHVPLSILLGRHDKSVQRVIGYTNLPFFGHGSMHQLEWWKELLYQLIDTDQFIESVLTRHKGHEFSYQRMTVSEKGYRFLYGIYDTSVSEMELKARRGNRPSYDSAVHIYSSPPSTMLRKYMALEQRKQQQYVGSYNMASALSNQSRPRKGMFQCLPTGMAFDSIVARQQQEYHNSHDSDNSGNKNHVTDKILKLRCKLDSIIRKIRSQLAKDTGVNPYNILIAADIDQIIDHQPEYLEQLAALPGWGQWKLKYFGSAFCQGIVQFRKDNENELKLLEKEVADEIQNVEQRPAAQQILNMDRISSLLDEFSQQQQQQQRHGDASTVDPKELNAIQLYRPQYSTQQQQHIGSSAQQQDKLLEANSIDSFVKLSNVAEEGEHTITIKNNDFTIKQHHAMDRYIIDDKLLRCEERLSDTSDICLATHGDIVIVPKFTRSKSLPTQHHNGGIYFNQQIKEEQQSSAEQKQSNINIPSAGVSNTAAMKALKRRQSLSGLRVFKQPKRSVPI